MLYDKNVPFFKGFLENFEKKKGLSTQLFDAMMQSKALEKARMMNSK
jgi:hypothetical protein